MTSSYKGYKIGSVEKNILKIVLGVKDAQLPHNGDYSTFAEIIKTARDKWNLPKVIKNLESKNLLRVEKENGRLVAKLTALGKKTAEKYIFTTSKDYYTQKTWDDRWRVVIYDIPQHKRMQRDLLRENLKKIGFVQVQASVWAFPYPCEEIIGIIKTYFELGNEVVYMEVERMEGDKKLRTKFKL